MIENKVYKAIINELEAREAKGVIGNAHHLAQKLATLVSIELLPRQQRLIYDSMHDGWNTANEIKEKTGLHTKNISSQLRMINACTLLIQIKIEGKNNLYKKLT